MKRARGYVPVWAIQGVVGLAILLVAIGIFGATVSAVVRGPTAFFDGIGQTIAKVIPQSQADLRSDAQVRAVITAMPEGRLRVATIVEDQDRVVFTITADRGAVRALVKPGDEIRIGRDGNVEVVPTGIPGIIDRLQEQLRKLFGR
ncbi:MAG: hypothetical protein HY071_06020 [Chloroflexi bacterium]|nr:hypothetical protein [Chloroflexota bacterium]